MEATKIPDAEFKTMVIKMLKDLRGGMDDPSENLNKEMVKMKKDIETIKKTDRNEEHNNWNEEYARRNKYQVISSSGLNQQFKDKITENTQGKRKNK